jgi:glutathione synthase/RimK-type ligase-like ATP-grasp enzyme
MLPSLIIIGESVRTLGRVGRRIPGISGVASALARTRAERDGLREERDRLREELGELAHMRSEPSFYALYLSMRRQRRWLSREHGVGHPIFAASPKMAGRSLAASLGIRVPRLLTGPTPTERLEEPDAERFVVKPVQGWGGGGVYPLVRDGERLWSVFDNRATSWDEVRRKVVADQEKLAARAEAGGWRVAREALVEELVPSGHPDRALPFDWKCHCIGGRVQLVVQIDRRAQSGKRYKYWSPELTELGPVVGHLRDRYDGSFPAPSHPRDLVEAAERVAGALPGPYVRVDLYDSPCGVVFGEISPHPPGDVLRFTPELDRRLGEAWEREVAAEFARTLKRPPPSLGREGTLPAPSSPRRDEAVSTLGRVGRRLPGIPGVASTLARTRAERDRLREERDRLLQELREFDAVRSEPSFYALYWSMRRQRRWLSSDHGLGHPVFAASPKMAGRSLAASLGIRVPRLLTGPTPTERLEEPDAERFVVKPVQGWTSRGVYPLVRDGDRLWSVLDHRATSWEEVRGKLAADQEELAAVARAGGWRVAREALVEEMLPSGDPNRALPFDWKCYCIGGRVELVMQIDRRARGATWLKLWSPELTEVGPGRQEVPYDASLPAPGRPRELVEAAERLARALPGPFVRVDLYDAPDGVVFGEISPHPGGTNQFTPDLDRRMGEAWERALAAELARTLKRPRTRLTARARYLRRRLVGTVRG